MREIKFRAKSIETSHWVYGFLVKTEDGYAIKDTTYNYNNKKVNLIPKEVYPHTTGQYTGVKDKNGVEIYQGDILKGVSANVFSKGEIQLYKVIWGQCHWHIEGTYFNLIELFHYCNFELEVIGNIYENPELLEE